MGVGNSGGKGWQRAGDGVRRVRQKIDQAKNRIQETNRTNIIATNFVESI